MYIFLFIHFHLMIIFDNNCDGALFDRMQEELRTLHDHVQT